MVFGEVCCCVVLCKFVCDCYCMIFCYAKEWNGHNKLCVVLSFTGTYVYTPPLGTALPKGLHPLTVVFHPEDSINFCDVTTTVQFR